MSTIKTKFAPIDLADKDAQGNLVFTVTNSDPDRGGDRVFITEEALTNYRPNPILLREHDFNSVVGTSADVWIEGDALKIRPKFSDATNLSRETAALVLDGTLRGVSMGFVPLETRPNQFGGEDITRLDLQEISFTAVPQHQDALREKSAMNEEQAKALQGAIEALTKQVEALAAKGPAPEAKSAPAKKAADAPEVEEVDSAPEEAPAKKSKAKAAPEEVEPATDEELDDLTPEEEAEFLAELEAQLANPTA